MYIKRWSSESAVNLLPSEISSEISEGNKFPKKKQTLTSVNMLTYTLAKRIQEREREKKREVIR